MEKGNMTNTTFILVMADQTSLFFSKNDLHQAGQQDSCNCACAGRHTGKLIC